MSLALPDESRLKTVAVLGGTFDPPHSGHMAIAKAVLDHGCADEVWLMVSPENPLKWGKKKSSVAHRMAMAQIALEETFPHDERIKVSAFETTLPSPTYTYATLCNLKFTYPAIDFKWIVGGDNLENWQLWRNNNEILNEFGIIAYPRPGTQEGEIIKNHCGCVILKEVKLQDISSTTIRHAFAHNDYATINKMLQKGMLTKGVADYITHHNLYEVSDT